MEYALRHDLGQTSWQRLLHKHATILSMPLAKHSKEVYYYCTQIGSAESNNILHLANCDKCGR